MIATGSVESECSRVRYRRLENQLRELLGSDTAVVCTGVDGNIDHLWPQERTLIAGAIPRRQREFAAGRSSARTAIRHLNGTEVPIPVCEDRSPLWPAGIVGSIAHSRDVCLAVVGLQAAWKSIGIDVEVDEGIDESLWDIICAPEELTLIRQQPSDRQAVSVAEIFVAKEAVYKWHHPQKGILFGFHDVYLQWNTDRSRFRVTARDPVQLENMDDLEGYLLHVEGSLVACCATRHGCTSGHHTSGSFAEAR
ncbi:MAG: 4'-phosphopantetheinyl transferase superfamily protein [Burkholderiales bacterium]|nr:MAG: 4'-phosphopantetheinyl transferase superfamily protein [Burkholderiales bacterium]